MYTRTSVSSESITISQNPLFTASFTWNTILVSTSSLTFSSGFSHFVLFFISMRRFILLFVMYPLKTILIPSLLTKFVMYSHDNICSVSLFLLETQNLWICFGKLVSIVNEFNSNGPQSSLLRTLSPSFKDDSR